MNSIFFVKAIPGRGRWRRPERFEAEVSYRRATPRAPYQPDGGPTSNQWEVTGW
jgi:hypothetical protein